MPLLSTENLEIAVFALSCWLTAKQTSMYGGQTRTCTEVKHTQLEKNNKTQQKLEKKTSQGHCCKAGTDHIPSPNKNDLEEEKLAARVSVMLPAHRSDFFLFHIKTNTFYHQYHDSKMEEKHTRVGTLFMSCFLDTNRAALHSQIQSEAAAEIRGERRRDMELRKAGECVFVRNLSL